MFAKLKNSYRRFKSDPDVQELKENTAAMLRHELRRLSAKAKQRAQREVPVEQFDASAR
jgi:hypothetical protein